MRMFPYMNTGGLTSYLRLDQILGFSTGEDKKSKAIARIFVIGVNPLVINFHSLESVEVLKNRYDEMM